MKGDRVILTQLHMAQAFGALADLVENSTGYAMQPVTYAELPLTPATGMIGCITDSAVTSGIVTPGGFNTVLVWHNGTNWKVLGA
jgi:hypothetical protein